MRRVLAGVLATSVLAGLVTIAAQASPRTAAADEPVVVVSSTFDDGTTQGWTARASEVVAPSTAVAHSGTHSLAVTGRTAGWQGPSLSILDKTQKGVRYEFSVWVRLAAGQTGTSAKVSVERRTAGTPSYDQVVSSTAVTADGWANLKGSYTLAADVDFLTAYVEAASETASLHIDDFSMSYTPLPPIQTHIPSVKDVLADHFTVGAAVENAQILNNHGQLLAKHFNSITPGNQLKWDATEPTEGTFRFADADALVNWAKANGSAVRGHTLVWHQQTPAWVFKDAAGNDMTATPENKALVLARLDAHIRAVVGHYGADIPVWDVVNEVIDENQADGLRRSKWFELTGLDYLRTAFRVAREVAPNAQLVINDYNTNVPSKRDKLYDLVVKLRAEGVPIDAVGHQMHINVQWPSVTETEAMLTKFAPLGIDQQITEMDISIYTDNSQSYPTPPREVLLTQAYRYRDMFELYKRHSDKISSVTLWGLADDGTWLDSFPVTRKDHPLLFDTRLQAKDAYWGVVDPSRIGETTTTTTPTTTSGSTTSTTTTTTTSSSTTTTSKTATLTTTTSLPPAPCTVVYTVVSEWQGGFQGEVRVTNGTANAISPWSLTWSYSAGQQITQLWGGVHTQDGANVTVRNASWNGTIAPAGTVTFGFLGTWADRNVKPIAYTLNGVSCRAMIR
ncbi:endo-1,4-beta-xylanase [Saccharothrix ecbatanensis]|uniref:Beta-xylanase n=1 Tax=Saccharothrix ecbatanensis TaxID=1105145 RepID=A0A7W9M0I2_9PSEU|nr:endo-1,4-beta-xylanase [Saccharothrix ecbatanensis]MBB5802886.1 endo-1,4-beta-xylanase [Saccharothrix ecbatanensis]